MRYVFFVVIYDHNTKLKKSISLKLGLIIQFFLINTRKTNKFNNFMEFLICFLNKLKKIKFNLQFNFVS